MKTNSRSAIPPGYVLDAVLKRGSPDAALVSRAGYHLDDLQHGAVIGPAARGVGPSRSVAVLTSPREVYGDIKPHIIEPHTHKWGVTLTTDAARQILAIGASRDPERTRYKQDKSTYGNWALGFGMIDSDVYGYAWNYEHTNWRRALENFVASRGFTRLYIMTKTVGDVKSAAGHCRWAAADCGLLPPDIAPALCPVRGGVMGGRSARR